MNLNENQLQSTICQIKEKEDIALKNIEERKLKRKKYPEKIKN